MRQTVDERQYRTRAWLQQCLRVHGPDASETRLAAIEACYAHGMDPHFRYASWPTLEPMEHDWNTPLDIAVYSETEWQRLIKRLSQQDTRK